MKIPREIETALKRRADAAYQLINDDIIITDFIIKNGIDAELYDYAAGVEMYEHPYDSADRIRQAIRQKN